ncbi:MAG: SMP-30/gluconolactonase/LRE family protein [Actinomycetia bacterium]|nr:SMP-30/gluconolactonase/LRE family protein [Actinomycetes bacterium]
MNLTTILDDLSFPEGPRWRDGRLWFSDFYRHEVVAVDLDGNRETMVSVPNQPSGLGWLPSGDLLIVSMLDRQILRWDGETTSTHADLSVLVSKPCNDMVVDSEGRAYVGNFGFDRHQGEDPAETIMVLVEPDGSAREVADGLAFPNGAVITPDGTTLVVGERMANRLTAFDRSADNGELSNRRVWADLGSNVPDGICLDAEGAIWVADPRNSEVFRVHEGGEVSERISTGDGRNAYACMLGGPDGKTLLVATNTGSGPEAAVSRNGRIEIVEVEVAGAGYP